MKISKPLSAAMMSAAALAGAVAVPGTASASANGCTGYAAGVGSAHPQFCGDIEGSGTYVSKVGGGFYTPVYWDGVLCNTRLRVDFVNSRGSTYKSLLSSQENGCNATGAWAWAINAYEQQGTIRFTLLSNGAEIAATQETIK